MKTKDLLDGFRVELHVSAVTSEEQKRAELLRLDESRFWRTIQSVIQQALNAAALQNIEAEVRR